MTINTFDLQNHSFYMDRLMSKSIWDAERCSYEEPYFGLSRSKQTIYLFTDALKYAWLAVLTQEHTSIIDEKL